MLRNAALIACVMILGFLAYHFYADEISQTPKITSQATTVTITGKEWEHSVFSDDEAVHMLFYLEEGDLCSIDYSRPRTSKEGQMFPTDCKKKEWAGHSVLA